MSGMDGSLSAVKQGHKPVAGRGDLATAESVQHGPHRLIVPGQQVTPSTIAKLQGVGGGLHDVGHQERRHHSVEAAALSTRERRTPAPSRS
jgi:hypothetical protein